MKKSLYGKFPGLLKYDTKYIENCSEIELFIQVSKYYEVIKMKNYYEKMIHFYQTTADQDMILYFKKRLAEELEKNPLLSNDPQTYFYTMDYCLLQTARFNTGIIYNPDGRIKITDDFKKWYNDWQNYILTMDQDLFSAYMKWRYEGKNLAHFNIDDTSTSSDTIIKRMEQDNFTLVKQKNIRIKTA